MNIGNKIILIIFVINLIIDLSSKETRSCFLYNTYKFVKLFPIIVFHHILSTFMHYGWLTNDKRILLLYIFANIFILSGWAIHGHCVMTRYVNRRCGLNKKLPFRDLLWLLGTKDIKVYNDVTLHFILTIMFLCLGIYKYIRV